MRRYRLSTVGSLLVGTMAIATIAAFIDVLRAQRLLQPDQLDELTRILQKRFSDPRTLAKYLVQRNWLTVFQVNQLFIEEGQLLALGPYQIRDLLGQGGISQVFKAWDTRHRTLVALKVIRPDLAANAEAFGRFQREISMVSRMTHPNIVRATDVNHQGTTHFYAMEYLEGVDLGKLVRLSGPIADPSLAADYIRQAALALQHAHEHGLVHRDLKPGNLMLGVPISAGEKADPAASPVIKLLDMGLTRLRMTSGQAAPSNSLTQEGMMIGSPDYLAPEQARDARSVDHRADIYSLGCTFYFLLAGHPPFPSKSLMQKLYQHQKEEPPWPETLRADLPPGLVAVLKKMMAKRADDRYQSTAEVAAALAPFCPGGNAPASKQPAKVRP